MSIESYDVIAGLTSDGEPSFGTGRTVAVPIKLPSEYKPFEFVITSAAGSPV
jgi:hypothetical protein